MTVTAVTPQKRKPHRSSVYIDGAFAFGIANEDLPRLKLREGSVITREELNDILAKVVFAKARDTALKYLASRPRSYQETVKRLREEEYPAAVIARVMKLMTQYTYIDDRQFAADYAASRFRGGQYGPSRVRRELKSKGIADEIIDEAMAVPEYDETEAARAWLKRKRLNPLDMDAPRKKRCIDAMIRRGFSFTAIKESLREELL